MTNYDNIDKLILPFIDDSYNNVDVRSLANLCCSISAAYLKKELYYNRSYSPIVFENSSDLNTVSSVQIDPLFN